MGSSPGESASLLLVLSPVKLAEEEHREPSRYFSRNDNKGEAEVLFQLKQAGLLHTGLPGCSDGPNAHHAKRHPSSERQTKHTGT